VRCADEAGEHERHASRDAAYRRRFEFPGDFVPSLRHSLEVIARWERERILGTRFPFAVRDVATRALLGGCEIRPLAGGLANLSYWTHPAHRGGGVASRGVALACRVAFQELGIQSVEVLTDTRVSPNSTRGGSSASV